MFLAWFAPEEGRVPSVEKLFHRARSGEVLIVTSALTLVEVLGIKKRNAPKDRIPEAEREKVEDLFTNPWIMVSALTRRTSELARELAWEHNLLPNDAIHAATAILEEAPLLYSYDTDLLSLGEITTTLGSTSASEPPPA